MKDVVETLDKQALLDNTYIFFSSDNGYHLGNNKYNQYFLFEMQNPPIVDFCIVVTSIEIEKRSISNFNSVPWYTL